MKKDIIVETFYNFSENKVFSGDHVPWHIPLDGSESRVQHMLMADDPQLNAITTPFGPVGFVQVRTKIQY